MAATICLCSHMVFISAKTEIYVPMFNGNRRRAKDARAWKRPPAVGLMPGSVSILFSHAAITQEETGMRKAAEWLGRRGCHKRVVACYIDASCEKTIALIVEGMKAR